MHFCAPGKTGAEVPVMNYKKIAQIANVSVSTVSKALSGSKEVSDELAKRIIDIAMSGGYFEEKGKRKIEYTNEKELSIAVVCPEIVSIEYAREITAIKRAVEARSAVAAVYVYDFDCEKLDKIIKTLTVRNCADGIVLFPMNNSIFETPIPIVTISSQLCKYDSVSCSNQTYFDEIVSYLKNLGHKRIAFVGESLTISKQNCFCRSMEKFGLTCNEDDIYTISERFERIGYAAAEKMLKKELPTAVVCAYDEIAIAMIHSFKDHGVSVPADISVIGINDIPSAAYSQLPLTTVRTFQEDQGEILVKLLYDKIFGKSQLVQHITVDPELVVRKSTGRARTAE